MFGLLPRQTQVLPADESFVGSLMVYFAGNSVAVGTYSEKSWLEMGLYSSVARWVVGKTVSVTAVVAVALVAVAYFAAFEA